MWGTLIWRLKRSNHSKIRSAQKRYPCDRYVVLPMSPGWTWEIWRRGGDSNPGHPFEVKLISSQPCSATPAPLRGIMSRKWSAKTALNATKYITQHPMDLCLPVAPFS